MADWLPISPTRTSTGAFAALSRLPDADKLAPIPPDPAQPEFGTFWDQELRLEVSVAAQLGVSAVFDSSAAFKTRTISYDVAMYTESISQVPNGGLIYGTRWGAGLRTRIDVTNFNAKVSLSMGAVAAAASLGLVDASYSIEGVGISDRSILKLLPGPGRFDDTTHKQLLAAISTVRSAYLVPKVGLTAVPFMILVLNPKQTFAAPIDRARTQLFAMRRIREGEALQDALRGAGVANLDIPTVRIIYEQWAGVSAATQGIPSSAAQQRAKAWLSSIDMA